MGLDAAVYCDCFENGRLKGPPPPGCRLEVAHDGCLLCGSDNLDVQLAFDQWHLKCACEHANGILVHHRFGNIALVAALRAELARFPDQFPLLLSRVVYNGIHSGDFIEVQNLPLLLLEAGKLTEIHSENPDTEEFLRVFEMQMAELVQCALDVGKPVTF
jgi:hypothetical protein